ncbi:MAG TPA: hydrolase TatD [Phycisphaerales bacterium]|nr:hydrolase TatD [Phycisphaerales bacterium]
MNQIPNPKSQIPNPKSQIPNPKSLSVILPAMIDTHCHLTYDPLHERVEQVIANAAADGVDRMITVGTTPEDARKGLELTRRFNNIFSTVGVHPHYADQCQDKQEVQSVMRLLASDPKVVALGEMGLDHHYPDPPIELQKTMLDWQLEVCSELSDMPIIIHNREATDETIAQLTASDIDPTRFVFHCFTGQLDELEKILAFGAMVSFTGITTFNSAPYLADAAKRMPADRIMIETDSPYLTPAPHRKVRPNEPRYVACVADFIAKAREMSLDDFVTLVDANAQRFFNLPAVD